jgi:hypothetical protein
MRIRISYFQIQLACTHDWLESSAAEDSFVCILLTTNAMARDQSIDSRLANKRQPRAA